MGAAVAVLQQQAANSRQQAASIRQQDDLAIGLEVLGVGLLTDSVLRQE